MWLHVEHDEPHLITPYFPKTDMTRIPIVLAPDKNYLIPALTAMKSVLDTVSDKNRIEFFIFHNEFDAQTISILKDVITAHGGTISFLNMAPAFMATGQPIPKKMEMLAATLIPRHLSHHEFVFSLDADMLVKDDILSLIDTMPRDRKIGAVRCLFRNFLYNQNATSPLHQETALVEVENMRDYVNAGLILFNMKAISTQDGERCLQLIAKEWPGCGESIINHVFQQSLHHFSLRWNFPMMLIAESSALFHPSIRDDLRDSRRHIRVCHFLGPSKPWSRHHAGWFRDNLYPAAFTDHLNDYRPICQEIMNDIALMTPRIICGPSWEAVQQSISLQEETGTSH